MKAKTLRWILLAATLLVGQVAGAADVRLPQLRTSKAVYTNVVVTSRTKEDIYIQHDGGIGNVKITDIEDDAALLALGLKEPPGQASSKSSFSVSTVSAPLAKLIGTNQPMQVLKQSPGWSQVEKLKAIEWSLSLVLGLACGGLLIYLFFCYCLKLICTKAGHDPGGLIYIPILQMIPLFKAAGMSGWWVLAMLVPLLNVVGGIIWAFKIVNRRGKSVFVAIMLLLPLLNILGILYLAFSDVGTRRSESGNQKPAPAASTKISLD